jgi:signal transduction histidine kinase
MRRLVLLLALFLLSACASAAPAAEIRIDKAQFQFSTAPEPPETGWTPLSLPDNWRVAHPGQGGLAWYRMTFHLDEVPREPLALYATRVSTSGEFRLNGSVVNPGVRFEQAGDWRMGTQMWTRTHLIVLPAGLFRAGENVLHLKLQGLGGARNGLAPLVIAPPEQLRSRWLSRYLPQTLIPQILLTLMVATTLFTFAVWWREKRPANLRFAVMMVLWSLLLAYFLVTDLPISQRAWLAALLVLNALFYWGLFNLFHEISGSRWAWYPKLMKWYVILLVVVVCIAVATDNVSTRLGLIAAPQVPFGIAAMAMLVMYAWRERTSRAIVLTASAMLWFAGWLQSYATGMDLLAFDSFFWNLTAALPMYVVLVLLFVERFIIDREEATRTQRAAVAEERGRILQDMHDGMGAQLITALRMARREDVDREDLARSIEESLQDLRLIIDSLDLTEKDLLPLLGNLRFRLEPRLTSLGIRFEWDVEAVPQLEYLTPESALAVLRVVQEALNNAIKHAHPDTIRVSVKAAGKRVAIAVSDDGPGFAVENATGGRGLGSMRQRAQKLGGEIDISSGAQGTVVLLLIPVNPR